MKGVRRNGRPLPAAPQALLRRWHAGRARPRVTWGRARATTTPFAWVQAEGPIFASSAGATDVTFQVCLSGRVAV